MRSKSKSQPSFSALRVGKTNEATPTFFQAVPTGQALINSRKPKKTAPIPK